MVEEMRSALTWACEPEHAEHVDVTCEVRGRGHVRGDTYPQAREGEPADFPARGYDQ